MCTCVYCTFETFLSQIGNALIVSRCDAICKKLERLLQSNLLALIIIALKWAVAMMVYQYPVLVSVSDIFYPFCAFVRLA